MSRATRALALLCLVLAQATGQLLPQQASAGTVGPAFATVSGSCTAGNSSVVQSPPIATAHPDSVARLTPSGGTVSWADDAYRYVGAAGGDAAWRIGPQVDANESVTARVFCGTNQSSSYTVEYFDTPAAPVTYSARNTPVDGMTGSELPFRAPGTATYAADVTITQGAGEFCGTSSFNGYYSSSPVCTTIASSQTISLGTIQPGVGHVEVNAKDGPPLAYQITIRPMPVAISGLAFPVAFARGGVALDIPYSTDGDTSITATITGPSGAVVRALASALPVDRGSHSLTWDGRGNGGTALLDGSYTLTVASKDPSGQSSQATASVTLDSAPPVAAFAAPANPQSHASLEVSDATSGMSSADVSVERTSAGYSGLVASYQGNPTITVPAPSGGWRSGDRVVVELADKAGNTVTNSHAVVVQAPAGTGKDPTAKRRKCGHVSFQRGTDWAAWDIRATGVTCGTARTVARRSKRAPRRYRKSGFLCRRGRRSDRGLSSFPYRCTRGSARVTFKLS